MVSFAAHHLGLAPEFASKRPVPPADLQAHQFEVVLDVADEIPPERLSLPEHLEPGRADWDGRLILRSQTVESEPDASPPVAPFEPYWQGASTDRFGWWDRVMAGGVDDDNLALGVGQHVVDRLRRTRDVLHLYIDAERVFPQVEIQDAEVLALARQDLSASEWMRRQASIVTQNLYLEWMRAMLGQQQQLQSEYFQAAQAADREGIDIPRPEDPLEHYREALRGVLPHLDFVRLDQDQRRLIYNTSGTELPYEHLSGGERELAFLVGQVERFGVRRGLFLLDEPELHLNAELLRRWLDYLRATVDTGQVWIATHALEAAEVAGLSSTLVMERGEGRVVRRVEELGDRPALATLAGQVGTPAFSLVNSRFVLIEGERPGRERERFSRVLNAAPTDRFLESGGHREVLGRLRALETLASEVEQLTVGAIIDRDMRSDDDVEQIEGEERVLVLPLHEIENFFLDPDLLEALLEQGRDEEVDPHQLIREISDRSAGRWVLERASQRAGWADIPGTVVGTARAMSWADIEGDERAGAQRLVDAFAGLDAGEQIRRRNAVLSSISALRDLRHDRDRLWKECFGKEVLRHIPERIGLRDAEALEARATRLWQEGRVTRPREVDPIRTYIAGLAILGESSG